jgi:hypothetical protein
MFVHRTGLIVFIEDSHCRHYQVMLAFVFCLLRRWAA